MRPRVVVWDTVDVKPEEVASFLTRTNFQPGEFHIMPGRFLSQTVTIVYVRKSYDG